MDRKELEFILQEGEGYRIEFKESVSGLDKEMCAFANASGGFIYLGIADNGTLKGVTITNKLKSQIVDIAANCDPAIKVILREFENVLIIEVREGGDKPYRCSSGFYNRIGPNSQKLRRNEIIEFVHSEGKVRFDEQVFRDFDQNDFDNEKLVQFLHLAQISPLLETSYILRNLHVAEIQQGKTIYHNSAVLFFAKNLDHHFYHTVVTCALYKGLGKIDILDRKDFNRDLKFNVDEAMLFLERHLSVRYEFDGSPRRKEISAIPLEALREAVLNAVIHRDYFDKSANVMVEIFSDRVEITSPGGLPNGLKPEEFGTRSVLRNPNIANLFQRIEYIEKMGTGIRRIQNMMIEAGLPSVQYEWDNYVKAIFKSTYKPTSSRVAEKSSSKLYAVDEMGGTSVGTLNDTLKLLYDEIGKHPGIQAIVLAKNLGRPLDTVKKQIGKLTKIGLVERHGSRKTGGYHQRIRPYL